MPSNCCYVQHGGRRRAQASGREAGTTVPTRGCPPHCPPCEAPTEPRPAQPASRGGLQHPPARCRAASGRRTRPGPARASARGHPPLDRRRACAAEPGRRGSGRERSAAVRAEESGGTELEQLRGWGVLALIKQHLLLSNVVFYGEQTAPPSPGCLHSCCPSAPQPPALSAGGGRRPFPGDGRRSFRFSTPVRQKKAPGLSAAQQTLLLLPPDRL